MSINLKGNEIFFRCSMDFDQLNSLKSIVDSFKDYSFVFSEIIAENRLNSKNCEMTIKLELIDNK